MAYLARVCQKLTQNACQITYESIDIVMDSRKSGFRKRRINGQRPALMSILNDVNCLLCSGFGDTIIGKRSQSLLSLCNRIAEGSNLMAATMHSIKIVATKCGGNVEGEMQMLTTEHR